MEFKFVEIGSQEYQQGLLVREALFFKDFENAQGLLNDAHEQQSIHLVGLNDEQVVGTGRLTIIENTAVISQMTVLPNFQKQHIPRKQQTQKTS